MLDARRLLREAEAFYDVSPALSRVAENDAWRTAFRSGADWMRLAMSEVRGSSLPVHQAPFAWLGFAKYALASTSALLTLLVSLKCWMLLPLVVPAFYAVEVQWVFLFPVALNGSTAPWRDSRAVMRKHFGTWVMMSFVLPFAWRMLTGGFHGRGFVRSWCIGCLAVVLLYERCRQMPLITQNENELSKLEIGGRSPLLVRTEKITLPCTSPVRLLLVSDLHLKGKSSATLLQAIGNALRFTQPDAVVLGGDLADSATGLVALQQHLPEWTQLCPWVAVPGNHDHLLGINQVQEMLVSSGVHWLSDQAYSLCQGGTEILRIGSLPHKTASALNAAPTSPLVIVSHDPSEFLAAQGAGASLVLAGHLHGCQFVFAEHERRLLPGQWFYRWNVLRATVTGVSLIVSRGCGDTLPIRWGCPRELVCCDLVPL